MRRAVIFLFALAGCSKDGVLLVTVTSPSVPLTLSQLNCHAATGTDSEDFTLSLGGPFTIDPPKTFALEVDPALAGNYTITCDALDGNLAWVASGTVMSTITASSRPTATMELHGCGNAGAKLCDSFEGSMLRSDWAQSTTLGQLIIAPEKSHRGSSSLHFYAAGGNTATVEIEQATFLQNGFPNGVFIRFFAWIDQQPPWAVNATIASAYDQSGNDFQLRVAPDRSWIFAGDGSWGEQKQISPKLEPGKWVCIEWQLLAPDGGGNRSRTLRVEDQVVDTLPGLKGGQLDGFWLGVQWDGLQQPEADLWIDDLVVDDKPVGCDK
jgi:hypothetical protein